MRVRATHTLTLGPGIVLSLSEAQAAPRRHLLEKLGGNRYRALAPVCFKAGEELGVEGDLPKALADVIETDAPRGARRMVLKKPAPLAADAAAPQPGE